VQNLRIKFTKIWILIRHFTHAAWRNDVYNDGTNCYMWKNAKCVYSNTTQNHHWKKAWNKTSTLFARCKGYNYFKPTYRTAVTNSTPHRHECHSLGSFKCMMIDAVDGRFKRDFRCKCVTVINNWFVVSAIPTVNCNTNACACTKKTLV